MARWTAVVAPPADPIPTIAVAFDQDVGFQTQSIAVDNLTGYWLYLPGADSFIPPWWVGVVRNPVHQSDYVYVQWKSPFGGIQTVGTDPNTGLPNFAGVGIYLMFTDYYVPYSSGSFAGGSSSSANAAVAPPPVNVNVSQGDITAIINGICNCVGGLRPPPLGPECPSDQTQTFLTHNGGSIAFMYEIAGVNTIPVATSEIFNTPSLPYNTGIMTPGNGFAAMLIGNWLLAVSDQAPNAPNWGSSILIIDNDANGGHSTARPETVSAHLSIATTAGSYNPTISSALGVRWAASSIILASNGFLPTIIQETLFRGSSGVDTLTFSTPPHTGSLMVAWITERVGNDGSSPDINPPSGLWNSLSFMSAAEGSFLTSGRLFWKEVCA
jgi:hypothetical protein